MLQKVSTSQRPLSLREIARAAGRPAGQAIKLAHAGLLPGYEGSGQRWEGANVSPELAGPFGTAIRHGTSLIGLARLLRENPDAVEEFATALLQLAEQQRQVISTETTGEAA